MCYRVSIQIGAHLSVVIVGDDYDKLEPKKEEEEEEKEKEIEYGQVEDKKEKKTVAKVTVVVLPDQPKLGENSTTA